MSEERALLAETLERLLRDTPSGALWQQVSALYRDYQQQFRQGLRA